MLLGELYLKVAAEIKDSSTEIMNSINNWINQAVADAEVAHNFLHMEALGTRDTSVGVRALSGGKFERWKERRDRPYLLDEQGDVTEIEWAPSLAAMLTKFSYSNPDDDGAPLYLLETSSGFDVYPYPDDQGPHSGNYRLLIPYYQYSSTLSLESDSNWWTENAWVYLLHKAAELGLMFAEDEEGATMQAVQAKAQLANVIRHEKRQRLSRRMTLEPLSFPPAARSTNRTLV